MAHIVSFYSYKGGVGRSLCLANIAAALARRGHRVVCIDCDLEAGGLHTIFQIESTRIRFTILDVILGSRPASIERSLINLSSTVSDNALGGELWLLPAVSEVGLVRRALADQRDLTSVIREIIRQIEDRLFPQYILVDSRSGFADLAATAIQAADKLVCVLRPNRQNADGLRMLLQILSVRRSSPEAFLVLSQVPAPDDIQLTRRMIEDRVHDLEALIGPSRRFDAVIPYSAALALEENVVTISDPRGFLASCYAPIADWIERPS
jgi:MinD-like ATPase involved in chromosome partitioning or flagellar assembly